MFLIDFGFNQTVHCHNSGLSLQQVPIVQLPILCATVRSDIRRCIPADAICVMEAIKVTSEAFQVRYEVFYPDEFDINGLLNVRDRGSSSSSSEELEEQYKNIVPKRFTKPTKN
ncbi:hypothetical protein DMENIID0001_042390 [Sergentomyia squamirostris]